MSKFRSSIGTTRSDVTRSMLIFERPASFVLLGPADEATLRRSTLSPPSFFTLMALPPVAGAGAGEAATTGTPAPPSSTRVMTTFSMSQFFWSFLTLLWTGSTKFLRNENAPLLSLQHACTRLNRSDAPPSSANSQMCIASMSHPRPTRCHRNSALRCAFPCDDCFVFSPHLCHADCCDDRQLH